MDNGWQIEVEVGSGHVEGDCSNDGELWLELRVIDGSGYVQFVQDGITAFALCDALPDGGYVVLRRLDTHAQFLVAIDQVAFSNGDLSLTLASENLDDKMSDVGDLSWSLDDGGQKLALYHLSAEPDNWFNIDPAKVVQVLRSPFTIEIDFDGEPGDGDTDGHWVTFGIDLNGDGFVNGASCGTLDSTVCPTITDAG